MSTVPAYNTRAWHDESAENIDAYNTRYANYVRFVACVRPVEEQDLIDAHVVASGDTQPVFDPITYVCMTCGQTVSDTPYDSDMHDLGHELDKGIDWDNAASC